MDIMEIVLLIAGGMIFLLSFFLPAREAKKTSENSEKLAREEIDRLVTQEMDAVRSHVDEVVEEAVGYAVEKTERSLERLSNEKIMAVNEYSDTVLEEIHKNHEEAMFLYDMLNNKHINLKNTVSEVNRTVKEAEETVNTFQKLVPEAVTPVSGKKEAESDVKVLTANLGEAADAKEAAANQREMADSKATAASQRETADSEETVANHREMADSKEDAAYVVEGAGRNGRNNNERILELYSQGKSKVEIAKELGLGVGEVKLVIDLFKR